MQTSNLTQSKLDKLFNILILLWTIVRATAFHFKKGLIHSRFTLVRSLVMFLPIRQNVLKYIITCILTMRTKQAHIMHYSLHSADKIILIMCLWLSPISGL